MWSFFPQFAFYDFNVSLHDSKFFIGEIIFTQIQVQKLFRTYRIFHLS